MIKMMIYIEFVLSETDAWLLSDSWALMPLCSAAGTSFGVDMGVSFTVEQVMLHMMQPRKS